LLVDIVIGYGAHSDPATQFVDSLEHGRKSDVDIIASVTGTDSDPQQRSRQVQILRDAGVVVAASNAAATQLALRSVGAQKRS